MNVTLWGTRGSVASPGPETVRYGGNTACAEVRGEQGTILVLDAGTGIRRLGSQLEGGLDRIDLLLTHLHMDHIQGLGFFAPLFEEGREIHIWGPASTTSHLGERLARYLSPPLFPVRLRDLRSRLSLHDVPLGCFEIGEFTVHSDLVCHPGPTVGFRIQNGGGALTYMPDHEPALGWRDFPAEAHWTSGHTLAYGADVLVHDAQYTIDEYNERVGWGHSALPHAFDFACATAVRRLVTFHHDPDHGDDQLDRVIAAATDSGRYPFEIVAGTEDLTLKIP